MMNQDKKKMAVMGALAIMVIGVGAFQFMGGSDDAPKPPAAKVDDAKTKTDKDKEIVEIKNPDFASVLAPRDPFTVAAFADPKDPTPDVLAPVATPDPLPTKSAQRPRRLPGGKRIDPGFSPAGLPGGGSSEPALEPLAPPEPKFAFSVSGVITGASPAAVFTDASGNQRLVEVGQEIDGDSTLISVSRGSVRVKFHAKTLVLTIGGNPNEK
jgi:hypothetical protein